MRTTTEATTSAFRVKSWRPYSKNTLRGYLTLKLPSGLVINDISLHEKNGSRWTSMPAKQYELNGEKTWAPLIEFSDRESRESFQQLALEAISEYLSETNE
jgi:DNA-binding cell septation regulator SpoVG